jgi:hypothetical protein
MGEAKLPDFIFTRDKAAEKDSFMFVGTLVTDTPRGAQPDHEIICDVMAEVLSAETRDETVLVWREEVEFTREPPAHEALVAKMRQHVCLRIIIGFKVVGGE